MVILVSNNYDRISVCKLNCLNLNSVLYYTVSYENYLNLVKAFKLLCQYDNHEIKM